MDEVAGSRYLIVLMDMLNFGIVFPLLPSIAEEFHANATQAVLILIPFRFCPFLLDSEQR